MVVASYYSLNMFSNHADSGYSAESLCGFGQKTTSKGGPVLAFRIWSTPSEDAEHPPGSAGGRNVADNTRCPTRRRVVSASSAVASVHPSKEATSGISGG